MKRANIQKRTHWRVAAVQMKFAASIEGNLALIEEGVKEARRRYADVVLFPECATTGYAIDFAQLKAADFRAALAEVSEIAARYEVNVLVGSALRRREKLQNCLLAYDRTGREMGCYAKCQLTPEDRKYFTPGNAVGLFELDGILCSAIICHERRYPELVRLGVMAGAQVVFHPNAGMDELVVSKLKRGGRDGIAVRAFENGVFYVFANSVGPQGGGKWSAGDSKIVGPSGKVLKLANNRDAAVIVAELDLSLATRKYAVESLADPAFLRGYWKKMVGEVKRRAGL